MHIISVYIPWCPQLWVNSVSASRVHYKNFFELVRSGIDIEMSLWNK